MTIRQTSAAKGQAGTPSAFQAGLVTTAIFTYVFNDAFTAADDELELGLLPAGVQIVGATVIGAGLGVCTANIGLMSGDPSDTDSVRTVAAELFSAITVDDAENDATLKNCLTVAPANAHRAIGATLSIDVAAGAAKSLTVKIDFVA
jgi:hypothetical protein